MKLIIDISEELKSAVYRCGLFLNPTEKVSLIDAINNGTVLPDNATNGDMMKAVFNCKTSNEDSDYLVKYSLDSIYEEVNSDWWNTPYKAERKDNNE